MSTRTVSVIVPVYNGNRYLAAALGSVLGQSCPPSEVLVIDDGSTDPPDAVLAACGPRVRLYRQENRGPASARNHGIRRATGEFLAFIDQDDLWTEHKLALQLARFAAEPALDLCFGHVDLFWEPDQEEEARAYQEHARGRRVPGYTTPALLARRTAFERVGPLDESLRFGDAADWTMRARDAGLQSAMLPEVVLRHRMHATNLTRRRDDSSREFVHVVRTHLGRRREREASDPTVSFVVPVHNGAAYLPECLKSILAQSVRPFEVVVVDDGSTDASAAIAADCGAPVRCVRQPHRGQAAARNRGVAAAQGELVAFLDADDWIPPDKLERQIARFRARPELQFCDAYIRNFWSPDLGVSERLEKPREVFTHGETPKPHSIITWLCRRELFAQLGGFDEQRTFGEDSEWRDRVEAAGVPAETLEAVLAFRRLHRDNLTRRRYDEYLREIARRHGRRIATMRSHRAEG